MNSTHISDDAPAAATPQTAPPTRGEMMGSVIDAIGHTPLIRLRAASDATGCDILGKAEFLNPGQSVKDRAALGIIRDAEEKKLLGPGGLIVEGTAGNTGIGLAMIGNALGYRSLIVMPRTQSREKKDAVRMLGATLVEVDAAPYSNPNNYVRYAQRLADDVRDSEHNGVLWANQFDNTANAKAHFNTTGPEIWTATQGALDGFICSVGSGGTLSGVGSFLKTRKPNITIGLADPKGAALYHHYTHGQLRAEGSSITEGIGQSRITANLVDAPVDFACCVDDAQALPILFDLAVNEGMCLGGSCGINIAGAIQLARQLGPGHRIVTILCDYGNRYQSRLYDPAFLADKGLPLPPWADSRP